MNNDVRKQLKDLIKNEDKNLQIGIPNLKEFKYINRVLDVINNRLVDLEQNNGRLEAKIESLESGIDRVLSYIDSMVQKLEE